MCTTITLSTMVLLTVREFKTQQVSFSVHDITKKIREKVNSGDWALADETVEDVDGTTTFRIEHEQVKVLFGELFRYGVWEDLTRQWSDGGFWSYTFDYSSKVPVTPVAQVTPAIIDAASSPPFSASSDDLEFLGLLMAYLTAKRDRDVQKWGQMVPVTMKQIQSRFKGRVGTCKQYAERIARLGYSVNTQGENPSCWTVVI